MNDIQGGPLRAGGMRLFERRHARGELLAISLLVALGCLLAAAVPRTGGFAYDASLIRAVQELRGLQEAAWFFNVFLNEWGIPALWLGTVVLYLAWQRWDVAAYFGLAFLVSPMTLGLKLFVDRERPEGSFRVLEFPHDPSFPSGHTTTAIGLFGSWFILAPHLLPARWVLLARALSALAIGLTAFFRVWVGAHWPTDVTGSMLFGFGMLMLLLVLFSVGGRAGRVVRRRWARGG